MQLIKASFTVIFIGSFLYSCTLKKSNSPNTHVHNMGVLQHQIQFYDSTGNSTFLGPMKIWYNDSVVIQELVIVNSVTDALKRTTVSFIPRAYKYIDLKSNTWYDYKTFSDTARIIKSGLLPITAFSEGGWTFYANHIQMKSQPQILPDTTIGATKFMRIKFLPVRTERADTYMIGYLQGDNKGKLFSLEKSFSTQVNCTMTKYYEFKEGSSIPFVSREIEFLSDTLSEKELKVLTAWQMNQQKHPVH